MAILFLLKGYPRLSETFIAQEIHALEKRGIDIHITSLRFPTDKKTHPIVQDIQAPVTYLPEYLYQEIPRVLKAWWKARQMPGYKKAFRQWWKDLIRDFTANRGRRFGQALVLASELPPEITHLHAHFLHTPASVAYYTHLLTGLHWTCSAHAKDIWTIPEWEKREKLKDLDWLVTCTQSGYEHLKGLAFQPDKVHLVYHGMDFNRFPEPPMKNEDNANKAPSPFTILSVGRTVPKKGYEDVLKALAHLPQDIDWRFRHIGGGPLTEELQRQAKTLAIEDKVTWQGAQAQEKVLEEYRNADLFILASKIADDGDRDGLPNVLMEAQSQKLPIIATNISGIPELIQNGKTGILVPPSDHRAIAEAIEMLYRNPEKRRDMAEAGFLRVRQHFSLQRGIDDLERRFRSL